MRMGQAYRNIEPVVYPWSMEWHNVFNPASPELDELAQRYHLHPLHVEDCRHRNQRAKIEEGNGYLFTVLKPVRVRESGEFDAVDLSLFFGPEFLIVVLEEDCPQVHELIERVEKSVPPDSKSDRA